MASRSLKKDKAIFRRVLVHWYRRNGRSFPWREAHTDAYAVLVSEFMLQQTQVATVLERGYFDRWMKQFPHFPALAAAKENDVLRCWEGLGYYQRARNLHRLAQAVCESHGGKLPKTRKALMALPGIGPYTAAAVMSLAFNKPEALVDANVIRVLTRLENMRQNTGNADTINTLWKLADDLVAPRLAREYNNALMELGQTVCRSQNPRCCECPVATFCRTRKPESLPVKTRSRQVEEVFEQVIWVRKNGKLLMSQGGSRWQQGMWHLPVRDPIPKTAREIWRGTYQVTHHKVTLVVFDMSDGKRIPKQSGELWHVIANLENLPMRAPFRRVVRMLCANMNDD